MVECNQCLDYYGNVDKRTMRKAAQNGHVKCMAAAYRSGQDWPSKITCWAAQYGKLDCMVYAHENGAKWHSETIDYAIDEGHVECMKYAYENGAVIG